MDSSESRNNRNDTRRNVSIDEEVQKLLRSNKKMTPQDFMRLRNKYNDAELVSKIQNAYIEKQNAITKRARKFADLIREKYSNTQTPFHILLEKAHKYKTKYGLSDDEFAEFQRIYEQELVGLRGNDVLAGSNNMQKVLGGITIDNQASLPRDDASMKYIQEIVKLYSVSRPLHAQVLLQSIQYNDHDVEALTGKYNRDIHRIGDHVHPVIAALFLPKFKVVENHFLFSNIAGIVEARFNGRPLATRPDYEVFYALTTDPNDVVCDNRSPMLDLLNRAQLQNQLWNCVLHLRNGQYYNASFKDFVGAVDMCKLNKQDNPDLLYGRFDGVVLKRLLSAFSFRPTVVATTRTGINPVAMNPYQMNIRPEVASIPMINIRVPPSLNNNNVSINLSDAVDQPQAFIENGQIVTKQTSLIWSRGVLIFYVDRRATVIKINDHMDAFSMTKLPTTILGFERINDSAITVPETISIRNDNYNLRSVVAAVVNRNIDNNNATNLVIGSTALTVCKSTSFGNKYYQYLPYLPAKATNQDELCPIYTLPHTSSESPLGGFTNVSCRFGSIFIYENVNETDNSMELKWQ